MAPKLKTSPAREFLGELLASRPALDMLIALSEDDNYGGSGGFYQRLRERKLPVEFSEGPRRELRLRLRQSGLAAVLPAGLDMLPDIFESSPWMRWCAPFLRPRSNSELALHVCTFLDWYLDPDKPISAGRTICAAMLSPRFYWTAQALWVAFFVGMYASRQNIHGWWGLITQPFLLQMVLSSAIRRVGLGRDYNLRSEELFLYLLDSYRNEPAEGLAAMQAAQVAAAGAAAKADSSAAKGAQPAPDGADLEPESPAQPDSAGLRAT
ncbi:hypothetical protein IT575_10095 [bacterium]|nr:hypothetical protein [bacterium]